MLSKIKLPSACKLPFPSVHYSEPTSENYRRRFVNMDKTEFSKREVELFEKF